MYGDIGQRVVVENGDDGEYLLRAVEPQSHLDAEPWLKAGYHLFQYAAYLIGVGEYAAAAMLGGDAAHRAADVPVHLVVADFV